MTYKPKQSTKQKIYWYVKNNGDVSGSELERMADSWQTKPSVVSRRAREMVNSGVLRRRLSERNTVQYYLGDKEIPLNKEQANAYLARLRQGELNV